METRLINKQFEDKKRELTHLRIEIDLKLQLLKELEKELATFKELGLKYETIPGQTMAANSKKHNEQEPTTRLVKGSAFENKYGVPERKNVSYPIKT